MNDKNKKIIAIYHRLFISIATSESKSILNGNNNDQASRGFSLNNCELVPFFFNNKYWFKIL